MLPRSLTLFSHVPAMGAVSLGTGRKNDIAKDPVVSTLHHFGDCRQDKRRFMLGVPPPDAGSLRMRKMCRRLSNPVAASTLLAIGLLFLPLLIGRLGYLTSKDASPEISSRICDGANIMPVWEAPPGTGRFNRIDPAYPVKVVLGTQLLAIPEAYFENGASREMIACGSLRDSVSGLAFRLPELKPPATRSEMPSEGEQDVVNRAAVRIFRLEMGGWTYGQVTGTIRLRNLHPRRPDLVREFGIWKTPPDRGALKTVYWFDETPSQKLVIECNGKGKLCAIGLHMKDTGLSAWLIIPREQVAKQKIIVDGLLTLLERWRQPSFRPSEMPKDPVAG